MKRKWGVPVMVVVFVLLVGLGCGLSGLPRALNLDDARAVVAGLQGDAEESVREAQEVEPEAEPTLTPERVAPLTESDTLASLQEALGAIYDEVSPSVVYIQAVDGSSSGSGFVWDRKGHIVTNNHVVAGADRVRVSFSDGSVAQATVVGTDTDSDLAVLKVDVDADRLVPVRMADSGQVAVGQLAVAIGNPFGLENTMTVGFISAIGRSLPVES
ncbi:MAG: 2-alkenal reductase, partial [Anaerolineales bacterium]|nr:2-alkenal reductase [Anaerolineales bacterium]